MIRRLLCLCRDRSAAAAAELALSLPVVLVLMYATFELGNYFLAEHAVQKAVRDAARFGARLPITEYPTCALSPSGIAQIQRVARSGDPDGDADGDGTPDQRLHTWTSDTMVNVSVACDTSGTYSGVFDDFTIGAPVVSVDATVPYGSLWGTLGFNAIGLNLYAHSETAVFGA